MPSNSRSRTPTKSELELAFVRGFLGKSDVLPNAVVSRVVQDPPDFTLESNGLRVGLEVTRVLNQSPHGPRQRAGESNRAWICREVDSLLQAKGIQPLIVLLAFSSDELDGGARAAVAERIAELISDADPGTDFKIRLDYDPYVRRGGYGTKWPRELDAMHLLRSPDVTWHEISAPDGGWTAEHVIDDLQSVLDTKAQDLERYGARYYETWLLIVAEGLGPSSLMDPDEATRSHPYRCAFARAFFYNYSDGSWFELPRST